uniref:conserved oligomeric Golgi complex subunit 6-like n=1 Tax=Styela clava TaxID=7725 RepID=UPI00193A1CF5|nr:conserved oligomeric Golgi complex subunit 6-like [Styela clava]
MADADNQPSSSLSQQNNPLSRKLGKILDTRLDNDKDMLEALKAVSTFFNENNLRTRRNLRGDIERRSLSINQQFLDAFTHVIGELDSIHEDVHSMSECCKDMTERLKITKEQTQDLMSKTSSLRGEGKKLQLRSEVVGAFLGKFQLKPEEAKIFRGARDGNIHPEFFTVLEKVQKIHNDVKVLLRTNQQTAGLEIMEQMALHQESAYERLYRWTQTQCRGLTADSIDISEMLQKAMKYLQDRPVLFTYTLDEYAGARRTAVVRGFIDALTRGSGQTSVSHTKPIEMHSHDPLRYIGDMLAWLHQSSASEREYLSYLVQDCVKPTQEEEKSTIGHTLEGVCRPLKVRIEQVLVGEPGSLTLFKLTNLLKFYHTTIKNILKTDTTPLLDIMEEMHVLCRKLFFNSLNFTASRLLDKVEVPAADLGPSNTLNQMMQLLQDMLDSHASSVVEIDSRQIDFKQIMSCLLDPLLQMCAMSASQLPAADMAAYMINCLHSMKYVLALYEFTEERIEMLSAQIDAHLDTLVNEQAAAILTQGGIAGVYSEIQKYRSHGGEEPLSKQPGLERDNVIGALARFDAYVMSMEEFILPQVSFLASATLKEVATTRASDLVTNAHKNVYEALMDPANKYADTTSVTVKTPDQIKVMLY